MKEIEVEQLRYFFEKNLLDPVSIDHLLVDVYSNCLIDGKLYRNQLVKFLNEINFIHTPHDFFNMNEQNIEIANEQSNVGRTNTSKNNVMLNHKKASRKYRKGAISIKDAALMFHVSERTIQYWDDGTNTPLGYPGRGDIIELKKFANQYHSRKATERAAMGLKNPIVDNEAVERAADRYAFNKWQESEDDNTKYEGE